MQKLEYRCKKCGRLLFKADLEKCVIEVKCGKCGLLNEIKIK